MQGSFNPNEVNILAKVVDEACLKVGCADKRAKEMLALRVLDYAAQGERDFQTLLSVALGRKAAANAP